MVGSSKIPPCAYHSIPRLGIDPFNKSPIDHPAGLMAKCGNGICGHLISKLKNPLIVSMIPLTVFLAVSMGVVIASLMPFHTLVTVD